MDLLERALKNGIYRYVGSESILPGVYAGFDPAELKDRSSLVVLSKDPRTLDNDNPKLLCRLLRDLTIDDDGIKQVTYLQQARKIIEYDKKYRITKLCVDITSHKAVFEYLYEYFGSRVEGICFTRPIKNDLIQSTRLVFQEKLIEFNKDHLYHQLLKKELYELDPVKLKHPDNGSDDFVWALSLAIKATDVVSYKYNIESGESDDELIF